MTTPFESYLREKQAFFDPSAIQHMLSPDVLHHAGQALSHAGGHIASHIPHSPMDLIHNAQGAFSHAVHNPVGTGAGVLAGHVGANAILKARSFTKNPTNNVMEGMVHAGQGKIRGGFKQEMQTLLGGPEIAGGEYGLGHSLMRSVMNHPTVNGDYGKARKHLQTLVSHPEFSGRLGGNHITKNMRDAIMAMPEDGGSRPLKGVMNYNPNSMVYKARQGLGRAAAKGVFFGGALGTGNADLALYGLWNKGKERFAGSRLGTAFTVDTITSPAAKGRDGLLKRTWNTLAISPGYQDMRDLGASVNQFAKDKLSPGNFKDYQERMGKVTFQDPKTMLEVGDALKTWGGKNKGNAGDREMWSRVGSFMDSLEPGTREALGNAGRKGVDAVIDTARKHKAPLLAAGNKAYTGAAAEVNAQRASGTAIKDLDFGRVGDAAIDGAAPGVRRAAGIAAGVGAGGVTAGGAYAAYRRFANGHAPAPDATGEFMRKALPIAGIGAGGLAVGAGVDAGMKALKKDDESTSPYFQYQQQKAASLREDLEGAPDASVGIMGNALGRRFNAVPQPLPIRTEAPNHPKA